MTQARSFSTRVYDVVRAIPHGRVRTYGQVATLAGSPQAARAVGQLMKRNKHSFLTNSANKVPCHRVVRSDYSLGGFNGGTQVKAQLLRNEGWTVESGHLRRLEPRCTTVNIRTSRIYANHS